MAGTDYWRHKATWKVFEICSIIRVFRVFRIFRLAKHYSGLQILLLALQASAKELLFLTIFLVVGMLIFATFIFYAEFNTKGIFPSIPEGFWWAIITMTTVGYGDVHPETGGGYFVGSLCALCGIIFIGLPIPIIATNFQVFYEYANLTEKMQAKEKLERESGKPTLGKLKNKLFSIGIAMAKKDKDNTENGNGQVSTPPDSSSNTNINSSRRSLRGSKVYPVDKSNATTSGINLENPGHSSSDNSPIDNFYAIDRKRNSEDINYNIDNSNDKASLIRPKTRKKYLEDDLPPDLYPVEKQNNLNSPSAQETSQNSADILVLSDNDDAMSGMASNEEISFDPSEHRMTDSPSMPEIGDRGRSMTERRRRGPRPAPPPRSSSLPRLNTVGNAEQPGGEMRNNFEGRPSNSKRKSTDGKYKKNTNKSKTRKGFMMA